MLDLSLRRPLARRNALCIALALALPVTWAQSPPAEQGHTQAEKNDGVVSIDELQIEGARPLEATGEMRDLQGYDDVYGLDITTAYIGRKEIERYKGATPSDILNGLPGVYSGDARNSGALDVSIRGLMGPGRVPVTIDGSEQALTVWRGYNGIGNRNYIDPSLIGGLQVVKTPGLMRDVNVGIGGAVVVKTLDADDFIAEGRSFGVELKLEGSGNAVAPRLPTLLTGRDYRDVPELDVPRMSPGIDPTIRVHPDKNRNTYNILDGEDYAWRLALGWRPTPQFDLVAAYAYRDRGNYYAGKHNTSFYAQPYEGRLVDQDWVHHMSYRFAAGEEVLNTSIQMESWLLKATWHPTGSQIIRFSYRNSLTHNGEIMPSRLLDSLIPSERGMPQWPLSLVDSKAYTLEYRLLPANSRWLDLNVNLWHTDTYAASYNSGPFVNYWHSTVPIIVNGAMRPNDNLRGGIVLSNRFNLTDTFGLTVASNFQREKLRSEDNGVRASWLIGPRAGRREEWQTSLNIDWQPVDFLTFNVGMRYQSYWSFDDQIAANPPGKFSTSVRNFYAEYWTRTEKELKEYQDQQWEFYKKLIERGSITVEQARGLLERGTIYWHGVEHRITYEYDSRGRLTRGNNPCLNGMVTDEAVERLITVRQHPQFKCLIMSAGTISRALLAKKNRAYGWTPSLSLSVKFSDHSSIYMRYDELLRFPSMFGSVLTFSSAFHPLRDRLRPEHAHNYEISYIQSFGHKLQPGSIADIKITGYVRNIYNMIERDANLRFANLDKQTMHGIEFQSRYDNGRFFTDLSASKTLKNRVCDEHSAIELDKNFGRIPDCVDEGFIGSYLLTQATPTLSATWLFGGRLLDRRIETGSRIIFYEKRRTNHDLKFYLEKVNPTGYRSTPNKPFSWDTLILLDAYVSYRFNDKLQAEMVVTNLTDQFYADPATRSLLPAPGRTLKLSLTATF